MFLPDNFQNGRTCRLSVLAPLSIANPLSESLREVGGLDNRNMTLSDLLMMIIPRKFSSVRDALHRNIELTML